MQHPSLLNIWLLLEVAVAVSVVAAVEVRADTVQQHKH
jgi:hypothetical protein